MASLKLNPQAKTKPLGTLGCNRDPPPQAKKPLWETGDKPQASEPASGDNPPSSQQGLRGASTGGILGREPSATWRGLERLPVSLGRLGLQSRDEPGQVSLGVGGGGPAAMQGRLGAQRGGDMSQRYQPRAAKGRVPPARAQGLPAGTGA